MGSSNANLGIYPEENKYVNVHSSPICNNLLMREQVNNVVFR